MKGRALADAGKLDEALAALTEAWTLKKAYDIAGNLALVESMNGRPDLALEHIEFAIKTFPTIGKPEHRQLLEKQVAKLRPQVVQVIFTGVPADARIRVNDRPVGEAPLDANVYAMPGEIAISVEHAGDEPFSSKTSGVANGEARVAVEMHPKKGPDPIAPQKRPMWPAILGFSLAGAGLVVGVSTLVAGETTTLEGCASTVACTDLSDRINALRSASVWSFIGTGGVAGVSIGLAVWGSGGATEKETPHASLQLSPQLGGATLRGTFF
ncbi:MAG: hypothetical protein U0414_36255 [Polyangiaceae bacterium]